MKISLGILLGFVSALVSLSAAESSTLIIDASRPAAKSSPLLYGLMTEEINHCYDGGLYAELVQNRAFLDDASKPVHWSMIAPNGSSATITLDSSQPLTSALPISLRLDVYSASSAAPVGFANDGYWGIPAKPSTVYRASFHAKAAPGFTGSVKVAIASADGAVVYGQADSPRLTSQWQSYTVLLTTSATAPATAQTRLVLTVAQPGTVWFSLVSLFPPTWKDRPNGLRPDLMQMLVDLKPAFLRFPGGNYLEGDTPELRFDWKKTLGPLAERPGHQGPWSYRSTDGMGLMEFLLWCEDMGAEPVLAVYAGYSLKGQFVKPGADLAPYLQDAFEEIEYVTGPVTSTWGARRAKDGHPEPFKLRYVEIGNEDFFDKSGSYDGRFAQFQDAIHGKYPGLKCISTVGFEQPAGRRVHSRKPDVVDEHYYRSAADFIKMSPNHYEGYDRKGPEIFVGEWAAYEDVAPWTKGALNQARTPSMKAALGDAAFMTSMERNSDLVVMQCYAPLFANVNPGASQWRPNLIGYDALRAYGSPSYYAFGMFSRHHGDEILNGTLTAGSPLQYSVTRDSKTGAIFLKIVNGTDKPQPLTLTFNGGGALASHATSITLASAQLASTNSLGEPTSIVPVTAQVSGIKSVFPYTFPAYSLTVLQLSSAVSP